MPKNEHENKLWMSSVEMEERASQSFDKAMLALSSGALALSVTFIRYIAPDPEYKIMLGLTWLSFGLAILSMLASLLTSQASHQRLREILDNREKEISDHEKNRPGDITNWLNRASITFFIMGVIFMSLFSYINLEQSTNSKEISQMSSDDDNESSGTSGERGSVAPKPPPSTDNSGKVKAIQETFGHAAPTPPPPDNDE